MWVGSIGLRHNSDLARLKIRSDTISEIPGSSPNLRDLLASFRGHFHADLRICKLQVARANEAVSEINIMSDGVTYPG